MRVLLKATMNIEAWNRAIRQGNISTTIQSILEEQKPLQNLDRRALLPSRGAGGFTVAGILSPHRKRPQFRGGRHVAS